MILLLLLLQIHGYAADVIKKQIDVLREDRAQLVEQKRALKDDYTNSLRYITEAIQEIDDAKALLSPTDDREAIIALNRKRAEFVKERQALMERKDSADLRDLNAEIAAIDSKIASLLLSLAKVPRESQ